jgi:fermentation-respiration switch protein FrsA (DUF1100 family)
MKMARMPKVLLIALVVTGALWLLVRWLEPRLAFFPTAGEDDTPAAMGILFEAASLPTRDGETLRAWYLPHERPRAFVLYFHGNGGNLSIWLPMLAAVHRQGYAVAAIDYRGYGLSTGSPSEQGLYRDVDAAIAWASRLRRPDVPLVFWGRSLGTTMAAYAATKARPDGLILESGFPDMHAVIRDSPLLRVLSVFASYRLPTAEYAARAGRPVLVMHGDADSVIPFRNGRALFDAIPGPKRFEVIRGGDHNDLAPPDPVRYWVAIHEFTSSVRTAARP